MARIRTIKPDFFLHETVAALSPLHRLLFVGLWTLADKRGVLEDRPRRIKAALFPWDDCDVDSMLWDLEGAGLIRRFSGLDKQGEDAEAIIIPGFLRNQKPHPKESENDLPNQDCSLSRERKRQAEPNQPSIPSTTAGKGRSLGKESWEGKEPPKTGGAANPVVAMGAITIPALAKTAVGVIDGDGGDLRSGIERLWKRHRGTPWVWKHRDEEALRPAFDLAGGDLQLLLRVFESGLQKSFPKLTKLAHLTEHWNDYAATRGPEPARTGRASASDTAWDEGPDTGPEILQPLEAL